MGGSRIKENKDSSGQGQGLSFVIMIAEESLPDMVKIKEVGSNSCGYLREECSSRKEEPPVQRPRGNSIIGESQEQQGGQCGWSRWSKGAVVGRRAERELGTR